MLIGSNDRQTLHDANGSYEPGTPEWQTAYTQRIETIAGLFRDKKIPLIWVGLPIMKSERLSADVMTFNQFYRAYAEKAGATYIDIWEAFADEAGQYSVSGPDINGQIIKLRASDGVHFTKAGARKLAISWSPKSAASSKKMQPNIEPEIAPGVPPNPANGQGWRGNHPPMFRPCQGRSRAAAAKTHRWPGAAVDGPARGPRR